MTRRGLGQVMVVTERWCVQLASLCRSAGSTAGAALLCRSRTRRHGKPRWTWSVMWYVVPLLLLCLPGNTAAATGITPRHTR